MKYTIKTTVYETAMLDAACRACGLPLAGALTMAANRLHAEELRPEDEELPEEETDGDIAADEKP